MENFMHFLMKMAATRFATWMAKNYPHHKTIEGAQSLWTTAALHEDFNNWKTADELYEIFLEQERDHIARSNAALLENAQTNLGQEK